MQIKDTFSSKKWCETETELEAEVQSDVGIDESGGNIAIDGTT